VGALINFTALHAAARQSIALAGPYVGFLHRLGSRLTFFPVRHLCLKVDYLPIAIRHYILTKTHGFIVLLRPQN